MVDAQCGIFIDDGQRQEVPLAKQDLLLGDIKLEDVASVLGDRRETETIETFDPLRSSDHASQLSIDVDDVEVFALVPWVLVEHEPGEERELARRGGGHKVGNIRKSDAIVISELEVLVCVGSGDDAVVDCLGEETLRRPGRRRHQMHLEHNSKDDEIPCAHSANFALLPHAKSTSLHICHHFELFVL